MTGTRKAALAAILLLGASLPARADEMGPPAHGFEVGFRTGASFPVGEVESAFPTSLSGQVGVQFPLWLDIGYRFGDVVVGTYGEWAAGLIGSDFECRNTTCWVSAWRAGLEVQIHPAGRGRAVDPWISLGFGYEWITQHFTDQLRGTSGWQTFHAWDFARYGLGVDFALTPSLKVGPFVHGTVSQVVESTTDHYPYSQGISQKAVHGWITVGVKLTSLL